MRPKPASLASFGFVIGGAGNVAFSMHSGSSYSLAFLRFALGFLLVSTLLLVKRTSISLDLLRRPSIWVFSLADAGAVVSFMLASAYTSTLVFTLIGSLSPLTVLVVAPFFGHSKLSRREIFCAIIALSASAGVALLQDSSDTTALLGVVLAAIGALLGAASRLAAPAASTEAHPLVLMWIFTAVGSAALSVWWVLGADLSAPASTWLAALFIALLPGGLGKLFVWSSSNKLSPQTVSMLSYAAPAFAIMAAIFALDEVPSTSQALLTFTSLAAAIFFVRTRPSAKPMVQD